MSRKRRMPRMPRPVRLAVIHVECPICHGWVWVESWSAWRRQGGRCHECVVRMAEYEAERQLRARGVAVRYAED